MKLSEFDKSKYGIEGTGIYSQVTNDVVYKNKTTHDVTFTIPVGARVHVWFSPKKYPDIIFVEYEGEVKLSKTAYGFNKFTKMQKPPGMRALQKRQFDGISKSVVGEKVEPDGYGPTGAPSWELVLGII